MTKVEGYIPIEQLKNGWTFPEYDPDNPDHERFVHLFAELIVKVRARQATERRAKAEAEAVAVEPKFVRVRHRAH